MARKRLKPSQQSPASPRKHSNRAALLGLAALVVAILLGIGIFRFVNRPTAEKLYQQGLELSRAGKGAEAHVAWEQAVHLDPKYAPPYLAIAQQAERAGDMGAAIRTLEILHRNNPKEPNVLGQLAQLYGMANRFETALTTARQAIQADPNDVDAHNALGMLLELAEDHTHAAEELGRVHALSPGDKALTLDYARVLALAGHADQAFPILSEIEVQSHQTDYATQADYLTGWLLAEYGKDGRHPNMKLALPCLENVLKYDPRNIAGNTEIGLIYERQGQDEKALPYLERAAQLGPSNVEAIHALVRVALRLGRADLVIAAQSNTAVDRVVALRTARNRYLNHPE
ncbi:MAG TPA: tetratricopeptide repeat protein, partial [Chthonomonadaceae bacterium]|nr:tetratricopeptide repeat protein [Chthonomonadaceae bacterium]